METRKHIAAEKLGCGTHNCAQAVICTYADLIGLDEETDVLCGGLGQGAVNMLNQLGIRIHAGAPELPVEQVLSMFLNGTIVYGDPSCHHHCDGHHHE